MAAGVSEDEPGMVDSRSAPLTVGDPAVEGSV